MSQQLKLINVVGILFLFCFFCYPQKLNYKIESSAIISKGSHAPFWLVSNQNNKYSFYKNSILLNAGVFSPFKSEKRNWDYCFGIEATDRLDTSNRVILDQAFIKIRFKKIILGGGRFNETFGNADSLLSCGNILWSGNSLPIPKIFIGTNGFIDIPFTKEYIKFKTYYCHGWFEKKRYVENIWLHHKNLHFKIGGKLPVNIQLGLEHFAMWGGVSPNPRYNKLATDFDTYIDIITGDNGDPEKVDTTEVMNRPGNHLGSWVTGLEIKLNKYLINGYWNSIFEDGTGKRAENLPDGLWGITFESLDKRSLLSRISIELLHTKDQSGTVHDINDRNKWGNDNYFNHYIYTYGWSYKGLTIGNPLIISPVYNEKNNGFTNNKVVAIHFGLGGNISEYLKYRFFYTYSHNEGTNATSFIPAKKQSHLLTEINYTPQKFKGIEATVKFGYDKGDIFSNNYGVFLGLKKTGSLLDLGR